MTFEVGLIMAFIVLIPVLFIALMIFYYSDEQVAFRKTLVDIESADLKTQRIEPMSDNIGTTHQTVSFFDADMLAAAMIRAGYVKTEALDIFANFLTEEKIELGGSNLAREFRKTGDLLSKEELSKLGLSKNIMISYAAFSVLNTDGQKDPVKAYDRSFLAASFEYYRLRELMKAAQADAKIKVMAGDCVAAQAAFKDSPEFSIENIPYDVIKECPNGVCNCGFSRTVAHSTLNL